MTAFQKSLNIWATRPQKVVSVWAASASAGPSGSSGTGGVRPDVAPQLPGTAVRPGVAPEQ